MGDRSDSRRFFGQVALLGKVGAAHDLRDPFENRILRTVFIDERFEGTAALVVFVRIGCFWCVESFRSLLRLHLCHLVWLDENKLRLRIDETANQPRRCHAVNSDLFAGNPLH